MVEYLETATLERIFFANNINLPPPRKLHEGASDVVPFCLIADAAFPFGNNLMRPFPGQYLPLEQRVFNYRYGLIKKKLKTLIIFNLNYSILALSLGILT